MVNKNCFRPITPILPTVYQDSLSYLECISKLVKSINDVIEQINSVTTNAVDIANQYTNEKILELVSDVNKAVADILAVEVRLDKQYDDFIKVVNAQLVIFNNEIRKIDERLTIGLLGANEYTNFVVKQNNEYLLNELNKGFLKLKVVNYFTGELVTVQEMFDYLALFHLQNAISYNQLEARQKTYSELDALNISYSELVINGANIIV